MKLVLSILAVLAGIAIVILVFFRDAALFITMAFTLAPGHDFDLENAPAAPDYANPDHWAALPDRDDHADVVPTGFVDRQSNAGVDVFFIHPTTYITSDGWNQPLGDIDATEMVNDWVMENQASVFNDCCRIFAPHYRQATLFSFMDSGRNGNGALDLAYEDVIAAFDHFIEAYNEGRPFIIAGHSQGSRHAVPLIRDRVVGTPLMEQFVAAYPIGYNIGANEPGIPVCTNGVDTGCFVTWNAVGPEASAFGSDGSSVCVNPLTWSTDDSGAPFDTNQGALAVGFRDIEPGAADGQCTEGQLLVTEIRSDRFGDRPLGRDNYHIYDYGLFWANIRANVSERIRAFFLGS